MPNTPPFTISSKAINFIAEIAALAERYSIRMEQPDGLMLRKANRVKTIRGTVAIEGNTLSEEQVTAIMDGKHVIAPIREIQEVRNAINAYDQIMTFDPFSENDLLKAHGIMALGLVDNPGHYRWSGVCVAGKTGVSHIAPSCDMVPKLMSDLFDWLSHSQDHILIKSCVFHYEFEFIHPFEDGNGRMGRMWQTRLLAQWNPVFANLPIENMIRENQSEYYKAIEAASTKGDSGVFIDYILEVIYNSLQAKQKAAEMASKNDTVNDTVNPKNDTVNQENDTVNDTVKATVNQQKILDAIKQNPHITQEELAELVGKSRVTVNRQLAQMKSAGLIVRVGADKNGHWEVISQ
ncbi:MAG: Fic family protein [Spirochaetales bacterium]|nr:Fic family protein [Spirochaetales bacterium]